MDIAMELEMEADVVEVNKDTAIAWTTAKENPAPAVYYVANDGNHKNTGLDRKNAWKTIQHAADAVRPGDTVLVAGGIYPERVLMRATGESNAPITFKSMPGEKVMMDGADKALNSFFAASGKSHLRFDGFYFEDSNRERLQGWIMGFAGEFKLYKCDHIEITRCFSDGRGGYTARSIVAWHVSDLFIKNCVTMNKMMGCYYFERCPGLRVENSVLCRPMISSFYLRNDTNQAANMDNNIFADMLEKKAKFNISLFTVDYYKDAFHQKNNCYFFRCFPPEERAIIGTNSVLFFKEHFEAPLFADPKFAGDPSPTNTAGFPPDRMMDPRLKLDFNSFFATNPEVVKRGIGLQPEAFRDYKFEKAKEEAGVNK
jgi:hypothetical protein